MELPRKPALDLSRFVASVSVCIFHLYLTDFAWAEINAVAVDYFFILSGFVLQRGIFARESSRYWILRRVIRIWTALIPAVLLVYILIVLDISSTENFSDHNFLVLTFMALFLMQTFFPQSVALNTPLWSLSAEFLTNLIALLVPKRKLSFVILALAGALISLTTGYIIHLNFPQLGIFHTGIALGRCITSFSIGIILSLTLDTTKRISNKKLILSMCMGGGLLFPLFLVNKLYIVIAPVFIAPLLLLIARIENKSDSSIQKFGSKLGNTSYIIYLYHMPFAAFKKHFLFPDSQNILKTIIFESLSLLSFLIWCYLFSNYFENRIRGKLVRKFAP